MAGKDQTDQSYDYILLVPTLMLLVLGLVATYSASSFLAEHRWGDSYFYLKRQGIFCLVGIGLMIVAKNIPTALYRKLVYPVLIFSLLLLVLLLIPGISTKVGGSSRWLRYGDLSFQPSELAKLALSIYIAYSMAKKGSKMGVFSKGFLPHLLVSGIFMTLILLQPDLGTSVIIGCWVLVLLFVGGVNILQLFFTLVLFAPILLWLIWQENYRLRRWWVFLNPWQDPDGLGFQIIHSFLALGSGGLFGVGLGNSKQKLFYLPEPHTDFILAILGEELGLIGLSFVVILFAVLIVRGIRIALNANDIYDTYLATGISMMMGLQVLINMGVVLGLLPTKGLTLPLISYGGSSLVMTLFNIGVLLSISSSR